MARGIEVGIKAGVRHSTAQLDAEGPLRFGVSELVATVLFEPWPELPLSVGTEFSSVSYVRGLFLTDMTGSEATVQLRLRTPSRWQLSLVPQVSYEQSFAGRFIEHDEANRRRQYSVNMLRYAVGMGWQALPNGRLVLELATVNERFATAGESSNFAVSSRAAYLGAIVTL